eukprot:8696319-Pyramimonas_sp.AAC.1
MEGATVKVTLCRTAKVTEAPSTTPTPGQQLTLNSTIFIEEVILMVNQSTAHVPSHLLKKRDILAAIRYSIKFALVGGKTQVPAFTEKQKNSKTCVDGFLTFATWAKFTGRDIPTPSLQERQGAFPIPSPPRPQNYL